MERDNVVAIIINHYKEILKNIDDQEANMKLKEETFEDIEFIQMRIDKDKADLVKEINKAKEANLENLDSKLDEINLIAKDESIQQEEKMKQIKRLIFKNKYCFYIKDEFLTKHFSKYLGALFLLPFYLEDDVVHKIR